MQKVTLEINNSIYEYIMFFLENLPKNLVNIKKDFKSKNTSQKKPSNSFNPRDFFGIANCSKSEIDRYLQETRSDWDNNLVK